MDADKLGPCPLCGGKIGVDVKKVWCVNDACALYDTGLPPGVWQALSVLAAQNKRRGEALERCRDHFRECDRTAWGPMENMCEEALK